MKSLFQAPIDLAKHTSLIYAEGVFGLRARKKFPMRAKTADGVLRYADYKIAGVIDSTANAAGSDPATRAGDVLSEYLAGTKNFSAPVFESLKIAKSATRADVLIIGAAPEGGELPEEYKADIVWAIKNKMHIVSGMHYALIDDPYFAKLAKKCGAVVWDTRKAPDTRNIPPGAARAWHVKKPIVLTVGMDAAIGKMTAAYEMARAARALGKRACVIPTGQTAMMIEGWGAAIDALPADFMSGAVEQMILEKAKTNDILFVEGQGSLFHPAYANTCISLIHGAVPTHLVLVARPRRKHSIGSKLVKLPSIKDAIKQYEQSVLPSYRNAKVIAIALHGGGLPRGERERALRGLPVFDAIRDKEAIAKLIANII